jgi:hypothetical protein
MNPLLIAAVMLAFLGVFRQFGGRLSAQRSLLWWCVFAFIAIAVVRPSAFEALVRILGIQVTSNFILGSLTLFCLIQLIEESAAQTRSARKFRELVTQLAAKEFLDKRLAGTKPRTLVVLPTYNEEESLPLLIPEIRKLESEHSEIQFCFVNDGSGDRTAALLQEHFPGRHCTHLSNVGVSGAIMTGFLIARALDVPWIVQCDSDGQHPIAEIPRMVREAEARGADILIGSRYSENELKQRNRESSTRARRMGGSLISVGLRILFGARSITDPTSGFRVYSRRLAATFASRMPDEYPEPELIALAAHERLKIEETGVIMSARAGGESSLTGSRSAQFMVKVLTALVGLRLRSASLRNGMKP